MNLEEMKAEAKRRWRKHCEDHVGPTILALECRAIDKAPNVAHLRLVLMTICSHYCERRRP